MLARTSRARLVAFERRRLPRSAPAARRLAPPGSPVPKSFPVPMWEGGDLVGLATRRVERVMGGFCCWAAPVCHSGVRWDRAKPQGGSDELRNVKVR